MHTNKLGTYHNINIDTHKGIVIINIMQYIQNRSMQKIQITNNNNYACILYIFTLTNAYQYISKGIQWCITIQYIQNMMP